MVSTSFAQSPQSLKKLEKIETVGELLILYNNLMYGYGESRMNTPTFVLHYQKEKNNEIFIKWNNVLFNHLGRFKLLSHETFDSINTELHLGLDSRNDLENLTKHLNSSDIDQLKKKLNFNFVTRRSIAKKEEGKYFFVLNKSFWADTYNGNSLLELIQDHEILDLTEFKYFDTYEECLANSLLIIHNLTQSNRKNCENFSELVTNQLNKLAGVEEETLAKSKKIFDGFCTIPMFEGYISGKDYNGNSKALQQFMQEQRPAIEFYENLFAQFNDQPFHIIKSRKRIK